jgi:hypothetical protein
MFLKNQKGTVKGKLATRFGVLMSIFILAMVVTILILNNSIKINNRITTIYNPSIKKLEKLKLNIINSRSLIDSWIANQSDSTHPDKIKVREILNKNIPASKKEVETISAEWEPSDRVKYKNISLTYDSLLMEYKKVIQGLSTFDSYTDVQLVMGEISPMIQDGGSISSKYNSIIKELDTLIGALNLTSEDVGKEMTDSLNIFNNIIILIIIVTIIIAIIITINTVRIITVPIIQVKDVLVNMGKGILPDFRLKTGNGEIGEMSSALNYLNDGLRKTAAYADRIGNGDMEAAFEPLSEEDLLGNSLLEMSRKLKKLNEEDLKRNWAATGLAEFAQLLRENSNMQLLFDNIMSKLVHYVGANQGAMFLVNESEKEEDIVLSMASCYAYNRKKYIGKLIQPGEGLIGQCYLEKEFIYLTDVPEDYVTITSGLGQANPRCISLFPLIVNDKIMGVIEIASFKVQDTYEIDFIKKLCENIAGTISNVKINQKTIMLLDNAKISQQKMMENEEEMRQNLEELTATQEGVQRREDDFKKRIQELENKLKNN